MIASNAVSVNSFGHALLRATRIQFASIVVLLASGVLHFCWLWLSGAEWSGDVSPRKPALFGVSAALTLGSFAWISQLTGRRRVDIFLSDVIATCLLCEVALITLQYWRGVPSHFNRSSPVDAFVERTMLALISMISVGIVALTWRWRRLPQLPPALAFSITAGLWLLLISCGLGFLITFLGELNAARGLAPGVWPKAGVLKYPHGAAIHALQIVPLLAVLLSQFSVPRESLLIRLAVSSQVLLLGQAVWQTFQGKARFDVDAVGGVMLVLSAILLLIPVLALGWHWCRTRAGAAIDRG